MSKSIEPHSGASISSAKSKCCSTLEKLRLVQDSVPASPAFDFTTFKAPRSPSRPPLIRSKSLSYLRPTKKRTKKDLTLGNDHLTTADAQWYLDLPQKVQRKHFTEDEQLILAGHRETVGLNAADKALHQTSRRPSNPSVPSLRPSSSSTFSSNSSLYFEAKQEPADSAIDMDDSMLDELRWMDEQNIDLRLDDYHIHVIQASSLRKSFSSHRRPSFRRNLTSPVPPTSSGTATASYKQPSSRIATPLEDTIPASFPSSPKSHHCRETQNFLPIHQNRPSTDFSTTHHYQDREARLKLRVWLASASKLDQAVEYGFPFLEDNNIDTKEPPSPFPIQGRPSLSTHHYKTAPAVPSQTFFDDSSPSVFNAFDCPDDGNDQVTTSLSNLDTPRIPSDAVSANTHRLATTSYSSSTPTNSYKPVFSKCPSFNCPSELQTSLKPRLRFLAPEGGGANREMTLRMALTRPDLRDKEDVGRWAEKRDPLALEDLPRGLDGRTLWDEPVKREGVMRRVWRRVSGRDC